MKTLKILFSFSASYGLSLLLLLALLFLVFIGTVEQTRMGLYAAQQTFFTSFFTLYYVGGVLPIPLPGGYLLLTLLFVNMLLGAVVRVPKNWKRPGLLIAHCGVLYLVFSAFVSHHYTLSGNMPLFEGDNRDSFQSYFDWDILVTEILKDGTGKQFVIPQEWFIHPPSNIYSPELPFDMEIVAYFKNSEPKESSATDSVDGIILQSATENASAELNVPGVVIRLSGGLSTTGLLWGMQRAPWTIQANGRDFAMELSRRRWKLPFTITLKDFNHEMHPGTSTPSHFSSLVSLSEGGAPRDSLIQMNEPLRHRGYTLYQASWGPSNANPGDPLYSVLAVVKNPAGKWPLYASCLISFGLILHYTQVLISYLKRKSSLRPQGSPS